jgi:hypothetical protein
MMPSLRTIVLTIVLATSTTVAQENRWVRASNPPTSDESRLVHTATAVVLTGPSPAVTADQGATWSPLTGITGDLVGIASLDAGVSVCVTDTEDDSVRLFYSVTGLAWEPLETLPHTGSAVDVGVQGLNYLVALRDGRIYRRTETAWEALPSSQLTVIKQMVVSNDVVAITDGATTKLLKQGSSEWETIPSAGWRVNALRLSGTAVLLATDKGPFFRHLESTDVVRVSLIDLGDIISIEQHLGMLYVIAFDQPTTPGASHLRMFRYDEAQNDWLPLADTIPGIASLAADRSAITTVDAGRMLVLHRTADTASRGVYVIDLAVANSVDDEPALGIAPTIRDGVMTLPTDHAGPVNVRVWDVMGRVLHTDVMTALDGFVRLPADPSWRGPLAIALIGARGSVQRFVVMP